MEIYDVIGENVVDMVLSGDVLHLEALRITRRILNSQDDVLVDHLSCLSQLWCICNSILSIWTMIFHLSCCLLSHVHNFILNCFKTLDTDGIVKGGAGGRD